MKKNKNRKNFYMEKKENIDNDILDCEVYYPCDSDCHAEELNLSYIQKSLGMNKDEFDEAIKSLVNQKIITVSDDGKVSLNYTKKEKKFMEKFKKNVFIVF